MHPFDRPIDPKRHELTRADFETIDAMYQEFVAATQQGVTGLYQIQEVRRAFYAGAFALFTGFAGLSGMPEAEGVAQMEKWATEVGHFFDLIKQGKA